MPRPKTQSDGEVLDVALEVMNERGPASLTFASLSKRCGLSDATLVQRFGSKARLKQSALLRAWDQLDEATARRSAATAKTPEGAIEMLAELSTVYGEIELYADMLLLLREDLQDPVLRARGVAWKEQLCSALDACFASIAGLPDEVGLMMASQWQGSLLWWCFDPRRSVQEVVKENLDRFVATLMATGTVEQQRRRSPG